MPLDFSPFTPGSTVTPHIAGVGFRDVVYTDGIQYVITETKCPWVLDTVALALPLSPTVLALLAATEIVDVVMTIGDHDDTTRFEFLGSRSPDPPRLVYRREYARTGFPYQDLPDTSNRGTLSMRIKRTRDGDLVGLAQEIV